MWELTVTNTLKGHKPLQQPEAVVCWSWLLEAVGSSLCTSLSSCVYSDHTSGLKLTMVGVFTLQR